MAVNLKIVSQVVASGTPGPAGKSAYQIAVDNGFEGTESEWLKELHPFKGWFDSVSELEEKHSAPSVGEYAYVNGATSSDPVKIYECSTEGSWSDSGRTVDTSTVQTFRSGESVNDVDITDDSSDIEENSDKIPTAGAVANVLGNVKFSTGEKVKDIGIDTEPTAGSENLVKSGGVYKEVSKLDQKVETLFDPIAERTPVVGYIVSDKWRPDFVSRRSMFIKVSGCKKMHFAKGITTGQYAFITAIPTAVQEDISYATGASRQDVDSGSVDVDIPNDANYVWIGILQGEDNRTPSSLIIDGYDYVNGIINNLQNYITTTDNRLAKINYGVAVSGNEQAGYMDSTGEIKRTDAAKHIIFPVVSGGKYATNNAVLPMGWTVTEYLLLDSNQNIVYASPTISGVVVVKNHIIQDIPANVAYVVINSYNYGTPTLNECTLENSNLIDFGGNFQNIHDDSALPSCDLNGLVKSEIWLLTSENTYTNAPGTVGLLRVSRISEKQVIQEFIDFRGHYYARRGTLPSTWMEWAEGTGTNINNNYNFTTIEQSVNLNASPTITTDTNNYLPSTEDTTDRTADILAMLTATGICRLGPGKFYVDKLVMPDDTTLIGCGTATILRLVDGANRFAIKMGKRCVVSKLHITGRDNEVYPSDENLGTRDGILWEGNYTQTEDNAQQPQMGAISDVYISFFTKGGITFSDTGYATLCMLEISNCQIWGCGAGLNISYWSEYHKFTNVKCVSCWYGCINNGGNNFFANCDFSSCKIGFLIDNSQGQSPNNAHGSCVGCVFNHTASNQGPGIKILGITPGFLFVGCQIQHSHIEIDDSEGVVFSGCGFGNCNITITDGACILFNGCMFQDQPTKTITGNTMVHFANCYTKHTGEIVTN